MTWCGIGGIHNIWGGAKPLDGSLQRGRVDFNNEQSRQVLVALVRESLGYPKNAGCLGDPPDKLLRISIGLELN